MTKLNHTKSEVITVRLSRRMLDRVRKAADRDGQQVGEYVRIALLSKMNGGKATQTEAQHGA
jgi:predicted DNA binding CopG/RHH family protein